MEGGGESSITKRSEIYAASEGRGVRGVYHEMFRDLLAVVSMHISEPQSRTVPMYIAFWQLHSLLYLEKSRDIWDSVFAQHYPLSLMTNEKCCLLVTSCTALPTVTDD